MQMMDNNCGNLSRLCLLAQPAPRASAGPTGQSQRFGVGTDPTPLSKLGPLRFIDSSAADDLETLHCKKC